MAEYEYEVTCKVVKGERNIAYGDDTFNYYTFANYQERIVRCRNCKYFDQTYSVLNLNGKCLSERFFGCNVRSDGFCAWGKEKD